MMGENEMKALFTKREASQFLRISPRSIFTYTKEGKLPAVQLGRRVLYTEADLLHFVAKHRTIQPSNN
jgi:excisionase family DNA binding protein